MIPATVDTDPRRIGIDYRGAVWAFNLGRSAKEQAHYAPGVRADKWCPFREGTRHRLCWYAGWKNHSMATVAALVVGLRPLR